MYITEQVAIPVDKTPVAVSLNRGVKDAANSCSFCNPCYLGGVKGELTYDNGYKFTPSDILDSSIIVSAGEPFITAASKQSLTSEIMTIFVGTNDDTDTGGTDKQILFENIKRLSRLSKNGKYIIISPYVHSVSNEMREMIRNEFGMRHIDMYQYMTTRAIADAVKRGYISSASGTWESLLLTDGTHPNDTGHHLIADLIIERIKELGY